MTNWIQCATLNLLSPILLGVFGATAQTVTTIHDFGSGRDGENPQSGVVFDQAGNLYGTAALGGLNGNGIVFSLTPRWRNSVGPNLCSIILSGHRTGGACEFPDFLLREDIWYNFGRRGDMTWVACLK